ncbi:Beta/gamma crystallin domain-containing protein 1 [Triplophysa tibetana]|uniref:Beta/gamma crystallin domain-containing protein 1 n=1 Tax=Triplophysa tibetana TaxID=1572043 RepID=A0A5A9PIN9_9TELE|nr:Beta/gamma crystallin domain-containing protein 1 [Triplophysa tibetana]
MRDRHYTVLCSLSVHLHSQKHETQKLTCTGTADLRTACPTLMSFHLLSSSSLDHGKQTYLKCFISQNQAESPQEQSPGVFSRIGSWLSWGWGSPPPSGDEPSPETPQHSREEDCSETESECSAVKVTDNTPVQAERSSSLSRNAKHLSSAAGRGSRGRTSHVYLEEDSDSDLHTSTEPHVTFSPQVTSDPTIQQESDQMGRKRSGKKRRSSQGDGGGTKTKSPTTSQPSSPAITSLARSPEPAWAESAFEEAPKPVPEFPRGELPDSPEAGRDEDITEWTEAHISDTSRPLSSRDAHAVTYSDMDEETVVRLTETPESKRRSLKVSHSEKFFAKRVVVTSKQHTEEQHEKFNEAEDTTDHEQTKAEDRARCVDNWSDGQRKVKSTPRAGGISDKISLFESQASNPFKSNFTNPRRGDISPAQNVSRQRQFTEPTSSKSDSVPSNLSVKDRALNFSADRRRELTFTPSSTTAGISAQTRNGEQLKTAGHTETSLFTKTFDKSEAKAGTSGEKPEVKPNPPLNTDQTDSKSHKAKENASNDENKQVSSPADRSQQVKSPTRMASRSKKRRSKEVAQPLSPTSKNKREVGQDKHEVRDTERSSVPDMPSKHLTGTKTTDLYSDKLPTNSSRIQKEKPEDLVRAKTRTVAKHYKEMDEKVVSPTSETSQPSPASGYQTTISSNEDQTEPKHSEKEERRTNESSEGESLKNRDTIVKPDPSVTHKEKPPAPEDLKEASPKYPFEPANSSSGKDVVRNGKNKADFKVLPEKDTATARETSVCVPKSDENKDNLTETLKNNNTSQPEIKAKMIEQKSTSSISTRQSKRTETTENDITIELTNESSENTFPPIQSNNENLSLSSANEKHTLSSPRASKYSTEQTSETTTKPTSTDETRSSLPTSAHEKTTTLPASTEKKTTPPPDSSIEKTTVRSTSSSDTTVITSLSSSNKKTTPPGVEKTTSPAASTNEKTTPPTALSVAEITPLPTLSEEKTTPPPESSNEKTTPPVSTDKTATPPQALTVEKTTTPAAASTKNTTLPPKPTVEITTPPAAAEVKKTTSPASSSNDKTTPPPASSEKKTTPPPASTVEKTTPPPASSEKKITPPPASSNEKTTPPAASNVEKTTPQVASSNEKTTPPAASSNVKTTPPAPSSNEKTTPPPASTEKKTTPPPALTFEITAPAPEASNEKTTPPPSTVEKTTPPAASFNQQTTSLLSSTVGKTTRTASSSEKKTTTTAASTESSTEKKTTPPAVLSDEKTTPPQKSSSPVNLMNAQSSGPATRKKEFLRKPMFLPQIPSSPGRDSLNRDSLSSWLDVERPVRKKQLTPDPKPKLSSSSSESNLLEASRDFDPNDFISKVKGQAMPFTLPQRRHKKHRLHTPSFAMPAIREDRNEKPFDVEEFQHGLRRRREFTLDLIQSKTSDEDKSKRVNPERESILTRSVLFRRAKTEEMEEEKENESDESKPEAGKVRSRLERCSILCSLSHPTKTRRKDFLSPTESPTDLLLSPRNAPVYPSTTLESPKPDTSCTQTDHRIHLKPTDPTPNLKLPSADLTITIATQPPPPFSLQSSSQLNLKSDNNGPAITPDPRMTSADAAVTIATKPPPPSSVPTGSQLNLQSDNNGPAITHDPKMTSADPAFTIATKPPPPSIVPTGFQLNLQSDNNGPAITPDPRMTSADAAVIATKPPPPSIVPTGFQLNLQSDNNGPAVTHDPKMTSADAAFTIATKPPPPSDVLAGFQVNLQPAVKPEPTVPMGTEDTSPPFPSFDDIRFPGYLEKILPKGPEASVSRESASGPVGLNKAVDVQTSDNSVYVTPPADIPAARGFHRRPGKIVIYQQHQFSGQSFDFYRDEEDVTHLQLSSVISMKVLKGCWILYEKAGFLGRCIALEEEEIVELPNEWAEEAGQTSVPFVIGSLRLAVRDYTPPRIELFSETDGRGRSSEFVDDTDELGAFGLPQNTGSIKVHSGLWQVFSDAGFQGFMAVLESGEYPCPESWGFTVPAVGSLRALRMGSVKVQHPNAVKAVLYEKAGLQGGCVEVQGDVFSFRGTDGEPEGHGLSSVASLKILRGLWVGYDEDGFEGQQFVLEEGEYLDWMDWGGLGQNLLSLRPVLTDFLSPHMKMFRDLDFFERGGNIDVMELLENTANTEYGPKTQSIDVLSGAWIVFDEPGFCGRHYVLEKGLYSSPEDWGSSNSRILSVIPIMLDNQNSSHFKIQLFSEPEFSGTSVSVEDTLPTMPQGFIMSSCRVHAGSWLAFGCESFSGSQCVLEDGDYPDLRMMGFTQPKTSVLSLQPIGHEFSLPSIVLFERSGFRGRRLVLKSSSVNLQLTESCTRVSSILVEGGIWVLYESNNFRGSQFLLKPGEVPDWPKMSTWSRIGSLRPLIQKQAHFRLRNKEAGLMMSLVGSMGELMRIQATEEMGGVEQVWMYQDGHLQSKLLAGCFVDTSSSMLMAGSRAVPSSDPDKPHQLWNISSDGLIRNNAAPNLVLEVKGGQQFDRNQIIINEFHPNKLNQRWSLELL